MSDELQRYYKKGREDQAAGREGPSWESWVVAGNPRQCAAYIQGRRDEEEDAPAFLKSVGLSELVAQISDAEIRARHEDVAYVKALLGLDNVDVQTHNIGRKVLCDFCNRDMTDSGDTGGMLFGSNALCADCVARHRPTIRQDLVERPHMTEAYPNQGETFGDFVRRMRGGDGYIRIITSKGD